MARRFAYRKMQLTSNGKSSRGRKQFRQFRAIQNSLSFTLSGRRKQAVIASQSAWSARARFHKASETSKCDLMYGAAGLTRTTPFFHSWSKFIFVAPKVAVVAVNRAAASIQSALFFRYTIRLLFLSCRCCCCILYVYWRSRRFDSLWDR